MNWYQKTTTFYYYYGTKKCRYKSDMKKYVKHLRYIVQATSWKI